jgi:hypothetical protein
MPLSSGAPGHCTSCPSFRHSGAAHGLHPHAGALHRADRPRPATRFATACGARSVGAQAPHGYRGAGRGTAHPVHLSGTPGHYTARITPGHPYPVSQCSARRSLTRERGHPRREGLFSPVQRKTVFQNANADNWAGIHLARRREAGTRCPRRGHAHGWALSLRVALAYTARQRAGTRCALSRARCGCSVSRETIHYTTLHRYATNTVQYK